MMQMNKQRLRGVMKFANSHQPVTEWELKPQEGVYNHLTTLPFSSGNRGCFLAVRF